jgi:group II intron reverse transcriptase/maturase
METKLKLISELVEKDNSVKLTSLVHLINEENLKQTYNEISKNKAPGIDGVNAIEYGEDLDYNIAKLIGTMKKGKYYPQPVKRVYIDKGNGKKRPLGLPAFEDKLVDTNIAKILNAIYEPIFLDCSYGFRPNRNCHQALKVLNDSINFKNINFVIDADIKGFFDSVDKKILISMLKHNISDKNLNKLMSRFINAGVVEEGHNYNPEAGVPQGGVSSPIYANIYLHYVLDLWFEKVVKKKTKGYVELVRYCDDFIILAENQEDTHSILNALKKRLYKFNLELSKEKTKIIELKRDNFDKDIKGPRTFDFLGFTHFETKTRNGKFKIGRKTNGKRMSQKLGEINQWLRLLRNQVKLQEIWKQLCRKIVGYFQYHAVSGNVRNLKTFIQKVTEILYKWINRRSQKQSMNWNQFKKYLKYHPLPKPRVIHNFYTN